MSYKAVRALAAGSVALSSGIHHFSPGDERENGRYGQSILSAADADKAVGKGLVEITGDATETDYKQWQTTIASEDVNVAAARRVQESVDNDEETDDASVSNINSVAFPPDSPARDPGTGLPDPDAGPVDGETRQATADGPAILNQSIPKLKAALEGVSTAEELDALHDAEEAGLDRDGAKGAIDERKQTLAAA